VQWYPLASAGGGNPDKPYIWFKARFDPSDPVNATNQGRTVWVFDSPPAGTSTLLQSSYVTSDGWAVDLRGIPGQLGDAQAARLLFNAGNPQGSGGQIFQLAPAGDFVIEIPNADEQHSLHALMTGSQPTEYLLVRPKVATYAGDRIRFTSGCPAYASRYPLPQVSPLGPPVDPGTPLLDATFQTSWATVVRAPEVSEQFPYVAQPQGSALFGHDEVVAGSWERLYGTLPVQQRPWDLAEAIPPGGTSPFPMVPYAFVSPGDEPTGFGVEKLLAVERLIIAPTRREVLTAASRAAAAARARPTLAAEPVSATTPSGVIARVVAGSWTAILLGQDAGGREWAFNQPGPELVTAFETNQLFMVAVNPAPLGNFANVVGLEGWDFAAAVGNDSRYDDYANVMIVKGCGGKLYDPADIDASLVANPRKWTQASDFSIAGTDAGELIVLSQWLQRYFAEARAALDEGDKGYQTFVTNAESDTWTGILVLRMNIAQVPDALAGITAGIVAPERFKAHHFGISITPVTNQPPGQPIGLASASAMFGLISYIDPDLPEPPGDPPRALPARNGAEYDFRVLTLRALFENSAVSSFSSSAQVNLCTLFAMVTQSTPENPYSAIVLRGTYQHAGGSSVYGLSSTDDTTFTFGNAVVAGIEVVGAQMATVDAGTLGPTVRSRFSFSGFIDFAVVLDGDMAAFDLFSFGSNGTPAPRTGLAFDELGLNLTFPKSSPAEATLVFDPSEIRFDPKRSSARSSSLFSELNLALDGFVVGSAAVPPSKTGFSPVVTGARLAGVGTGEWYGLRYRLDMGTPGALAGKVGLTSYVLTAWGPATGSSYPAFLGLQLPGTGGGANLISVQTVMTLSIGQLALVRAKTADGKAMSFMLMLTDIALKFFGILSIPPSGSTVFYLFGNPQGQGSPAGLGWYAMYTRLSPPTAPVPGPLPDPLER
jgi:hypothetical protein